MTSPNLIASETLLAENADCTLTATVTLLSSDRLRLDYRLHNRSSLPLYLLNQLWETIGEDAATHQDVFGVLPDLANVQVTPSRVTVGKAVVDVPYLMLVEVRHIPCMTRVAPGTAYEEAVHLPVPLMPYTFYESKVSNGPVVPRALCFELGYIRGLPHVERTVEPVATPTGQAYWTEPFPADQQTVIGVGPFQEAVAVTSRLHERPPKPVGTGGWTPWD